MHAAVEREAARARAREAAAEVAYDRSPWFATDWQSAKAERTDESATA
jgi:hypothetical protein